MSIIRLTFHQRCTFKRLVRLNGGYGRKFTLSDLKSLRSIAVAHSSAGLRSGYAS